MAVKDIRNIYKMHPGSLGSATDRSVQTVSGFSQKPALPRIDIEESSSKKSTKHSSINRRSSTSKKKNACYCIPGF